MTSAKHMDSPIRRRALLAGIGTSLCAGCLGDGFRNISTSGSGSNGTVTPTTSATGGLYDPGDDSVTFTAAVVESFTADHPAQLRLTLTNRSDGLLLSLGVRRGIDGPFTAIRGHRQENDRELLLFYRGRDLDSYALCADSSKTPIPEERVDDCWKPRCATGLEIISTHGSIVLGPGEKLSGEYTVLDGFDDGCLAPGTYTFNDDASKLGVGEQADHGVEFTDEPTRFLRQLDITLDDGNVTAAAEAVVQTDDAPDGTTTADTPGSVQRNNTSD